MNNQLVTITVNFEITSQNKRSGNGNFKIEIPENFLKHLNADAMNEDFTKQLQAAIADFVSQNS